MRIIKVVPLALMRVTIILGKNNHGALSRRRLMNKGRSEFCGTDGIVPLFRATKPRITPGQSRQGDDEVGDDESPAD